MQSTWQRGEPKSAIDLIMINQCGYEKFEEMEVDGNGKQTKEGKRGDN